MSTPPIPPTMPPPRRPSIRPPRRSPRRPPRPSPIRPLRPSPIHPLLPPHIHIRPPHPPPIPSPTPPYIHIRPRIPRPSYGARPPKHHSAPNHLVLVDIHSDSGSNSLGQALGPLEMRKAGLEQKLKDVGYLVFNCCGVDEMRWHGGEISNGVRDEWSCYAALCAIEDVVKEFDGYDLKFLLGGDCSLTPGIMSGLSRMARFKDYIARGARMGIIYFAGDNNLKLPPKPNEPITDSSGVLDLMNLSTLTQREGSVECATSFNKHDGSPLVNYENIVLFSTVDPPEEEAAYIHESHIRRIPRSTVTKDPKATAMRELIWLEDRCELTVLHFNVDVIDSGTFPLANYPVPGGLSFEQAMAALEGFLTSEQMCAVFVTGFNPLNDPDGKMVEKLVDGMVEALRIRLRSTTDGRMGLVR